MMAAAVIPESILDRLPSVRGRLRANEPLARYTWFRVGGAAEVFYEPTDEADLVRFLTDCPTDIPITILGGTSNVLIRDGGIRGVVIRLGKGFAEIAISGEEINVGAAAPDPHVAKAAADAGVGGLSFLVGIPGVVGGAVRMNAGAYGTEIKDVFVSCRIIDRSGQIRELGPADMNFTYRHSALPTDAIVLSTVLRGEEDEPERLRAEMTDIQSRREATQPVRTRTGGSTFANPPGYRAWELIDAVGARGLKLGGAQVSPLHCNFLINTGSASAADLEGLGEEVRRRVATQFGVNLRWEIQRLGVTGKTTDTGDAQ